MSAKRRARIPNHSEARAECLRRSMDRCEICRERYCRPLEWAHLFGRGNRIAEPLCSSPALTIMAGRDCHQDLDGNRIPRVRELLRWQAVDRAAKQHGIILPFQIGDSGWTALRAMTWVEKEIAMRVHEDPAPPDGGEGGEGGEGSTEGEGEGASTEGGDTE